MPTTRGQLGAAVSSDREDGSDEATEGGEKQGAFQVMEIWGPKCLQDLEGLDKRNSPATKT